MSRAKIYEYKGETGTSKQLGEMFDVSPATVRRSGKVVVETEVEGQDAKPEVIAEIIEEPKTTDLPDINTSRETLLEMREKSTCENFTALCNAYLQVKNISKKLA